MKVYLSPDIILCGWLGLNYQLSNSLLWVGLCIVRYKVLVLLVRWLMTWSCSQGQHAHVSKWNVWWVFCGQEQALSTAHTHTHTRCLSPQLTRAAQDVRLVVVTTVAQQHVKHVKREKALKCCALFVCYHLPTKGLQLSEGDCWRQHAAVRKHDTVWSSLCSLTAAAEECWSTQGSLMKASCEWFISADNQILKQPTLPAIVIDSLGVVRAHVCVCVCKGQFFLRVSLRKI